MAVKVRTINRAVQVSDDVFNTVPPGRVPATLLLLSFGPTDGEGPV